MRDMLKRSTSQGSASGAQCVPGSLQFSALLVCRVNAPLADPVDPAQDIPNGYGVHIWNLRVHNVIDFKKVRPPRDTMGKGMLKRAG